MMNICGKFLCDTSCGICVTDGRTADPETYYLRCGFFAGGDK